MILTYKNKTIEKSVTIINMVTAVFVAASFAMLFGFKKPLLLEEQLYTAQVFLLCVFVIAKFVRFFNAVSKLEYLRHFWFEIPFLLALVIAFFGAGKWFAEVGTETVRHFVIGIYLVLQIVIKTVRTSINLAVRKSPVRVLVVSFLALILFGTLLLMLPRASAGESMNFVNALFTATSAVTTTGLIVVDTGSDYSVFGQVIILILFQIGGLGYMVLISSIFFFRKSRLSIDTKVLIGESVVRPKAVDVLAFVRSIIIFTFVVELIGAVALGYYWKEDFGLSQGFYIGLFHSVSAFCTAGFSLYSDSMTAYRGSITLNVLIGIICMTGSIGFFVLYDVFVFFVNAIKRKRPNRFSAHTKLSVLISLLLIITGIVILFIFGQTEQSSVFLQRFLNATFQSVSSSTTTGFNTVDVGKISQAGLLTIIVLMFIGASPGGTGGGIKTTTFGLMALTVWAVMTGKEDVNVFKGRVPPATVRKAVGVTVAGIFWFFVATLMLTITENARFLDVFFEAVSALGTVGLSTGITPKLSTAGRIIIAVTMLIGRIGPLAIGFSLVGKTKKVAYQYVDVEIFVG
ncbi:MAG: hypothetical protein JW837_09565 [Sedimentisphaerales bacterium]|nr:hypothetical protein [Sedimentisphaerales bacterium]